MPAPLIHYDPLGQRVGPEGISSLSAFVQPSAYVSPEMQAALTAEVSGPPPMVPSPEMAVPYITPEIYMETEAPNVSFLGTIGKIAGGVVGGIATGGVGGAIIGGLTALAGGGKKTSTSVTGPFGPGDTDVPAGFPGAIPEPGFKGTVQRFLPGGQSGYTAAPPGYHVNKRYMAYLRAQSFGRDVQDPTGQRQVVNLVVRNRRMNPLNARALRHANARQVAAVRLMRSTLRGTGYRITRAGFGKKKARR
jgi:hypothetical protein